MADSISGSVYNSAEIVGGNLTSAEVSGGNLADAEIVGVVESGSIHLHNYTKQ